MEKKTIGAFIAVLRKAAGMTQRELAERLNVSDKSVSRWERDECAPDLTLIPVLAEIFDVTSDELLRGERRSSPSEDAPIEESRFVREKGARQFHHLIRTRLMKFRERSFIALGITIGGYLAALICNFIFLRAQLGFFISLAFYAAALIMEVCFLRRAAVEEEDAYDREAWCRFKNDMARVSLRTFAALYMAAALVCPMLLTGDPNCGLEFSSYFGLCLYGIPAFLVVGYLVYTLAIRPRLIKNEFLVLSEAEKANALKKRRLLKKTAIIAFSVAIVLCAAAVILMESAPAFAEVLVFEDHDSFKAFMETEHEHYDAREYMLVTEIDGYMLMRDIDRHLIVNAAGEIVCEYEWKNGDVVTVYADFESEDALPIRVMTRSASLEARDTMTAISATLLILAALEFLILTAVYFVKARAYRRI